jgi:phosphatidylserine decarboxylase
MGLAATHATEGQVVFPLLARGGSFAVGLAAESATYEIARRGLLAFNNPLPGLWQWSGPQGFGRAWASSAISFGSLRTVAPALASQNLALQHLSVDAAMVAGHHLTFAAGFGEKPEGNLAQQFLSAEAMNLQMQAGLALAHSLTGGRVASLEQSLDLELATRSARLFAFQNSSLPARETISEAKASPEMESSSAIADRLFSFNPALLLAPKALLIPVLGYGLSVMRRGWAVGTVLGLGALLAGKNFMMGAETVQWIGEATILGAGAAYGYLRARSLRKESEGENPFVTQPDMTFPKVIPVPKNVVSDLKVSLIRDGTTRIVMGKEIDGDGFPRSFIWSLYPTEGLSVGQRLFYRILDPIRFTFSMGRFSRSSASKLIIPLFARWKKIDRPRFMSREGNQDYPSFDAFFTRRLKKIPDFYPGAAPAEGTLIYMARATMDQALTIKKEKIALRDLLGEDTAKLFEGKRVGVMVTYLSPKDYHLSHSPVLGRVVHRQRIPGAAWTVGPEIWNEKNVEGQSGARYLTFNARDVLLKETPFGPFATVYVAATNVYSTEIHPQKGDTVQAGMHEQSYHFGSTNVYVFDADQFYFPHEIYPGQHMTFGKNAFLIPRAELANARRESNLKKDSTRGIK